MTLYQAQMLEVLSRTHSLSEAAIEMGTSQPRLTQQLKSVEHELGADLFLRSPRGLSLSEAGQKFLPYARQIVEVFLQGQQALSTVTNGRTQKLRLGTSITASQNFLPETILRFHKRYPSVLVTMTRTVPKELVTGLEEGRFDLCFGLELPDSPLYVREEVFTTDLVGLVTVDAKSKPQTLLEEFCRNPLVLLSKTCGTRDLLDDALRRANIRPRVVMETDDVATILTVVRAGGASTILPRTLVPSTKIMLAIDLAGLAIRVRGTRIHSRNLSIEAVQFKEVLQERVRVAGRIG